MLALASESDRPQPINNNKNNNIILIIIGAISPCRIAVCWIKQAAGSCTGQGAPFLFGVQPSAVGRTIKPSGFIAQGVITRIQRVVTPPGYPGYPEYPAENPKIRAAVTRFRAGVTRYRAAVARYRAAVTRLTLLMASISMPISVNPPASSFTLRR